VFGFGTNLLCENLVKGEYIVSVPVEINNDATELINLGDQVNREI